MAQLAAKKAGERKGNAQEPMEADLYGERAVQREMVRWQQDMGYPCVLYRKGMQHLKDTPEQRGLRRLWKVPVPGPLWKDHFNHPFYGSNQMYEITPFSRRGMAPLRPAGENQVQGQAPAGPQVGDKFKREQPPVQEAVARTREFLDANSEFRIKKVMGWGGMGAILMAELREPREGQSQNVVIKMNMSTNSRRHFRQEKKNHVRVARAAHVVQCVMVEDRGQHKKDNKIAEAAAPAVKRKYAGDTGDSAFQVAKRTRLMTGDAVPAVGESPRLAAGNRGPLARALFDRAREFVHLKGMNNEHPDREYNINTHPDLLVIEPMWRGDFDLWVRKMAHSGEKFHSKVLWLIFECCKSHHPQVSLYLGRRHWKRSACTDDSFKQCLRAFWLWLTPLGTTVSTGKLEEVRAPLWKSDCQRGMM